MYFLTVWDSITTAAMGALRSFLLSICDIVYRLIVFAFNIFERLGTAELLDEPTITALYNKVGVILGVFMVFRLCFSVLQYILNPDNIEDKTKGAGNLIKKVFIVIILLGSTNWIFREAYDLQRLVVSEKIIPRLILNDTNNTENFGAQLSWYLFSAFYKETEKEILDVDRCVELYNDIIEQDFINHNSLSYAYNCLNTRASYNDELNGTSDVYIIDFEGFLSIVVGIAVLWIIIMYTISVGFRLVQLTFLQLIAPIPIMMYLDPKDDGPFQKWVKQCLSSYLDFFIRTAIIYFAIFLIKDLMSIESSHFLETFGPTNQTEYTYTIIIMILALLMFAKKLPDILKDIMPSMGGSFSDYGFSFKKRAENMVGGSYINKGVDKGKSLAGTMAKTTAMMPINQGKKIISGIDSMAHGKGFFNGYIKYQTPLRQRINKQLENLMPETYKDHKEKLEGIENVAAINAKWNLGVKIAKTLMMNRFDGTSGSKPWTKAFDGITKDNYSKIFKHEEFINSKMAVDRASNKEEELRYAQEALNAGQTSVTANGRTYTSADAILLAEDLGKAKTELKGLQDTHVEISREYKDDSKIEQAFKFIKNNEVDPAQPSKRHDTVGIK